MHAHPYYIHVSESATLLLGDSVEYAGYEEHQHSAGSDRCRPYRSPM